MSRMRWPTLRKEDVPSTVIAERRAALLVPHARGKCEACGTTLVNDPLPHRCDPWKRGRDYDPGRVGL